MMRTRQAFISLDSVSYSCYWRDALLNSEATSELEQAGVEVLVLFAQKTLFLPQALLLYIYI